METPAGGKHLLDYWRILVRRRWVVYLAVFGVTLIALIGSLLATPEYRATATLKIDRQDPNILNMRDLSRLDYSWNAYSDFYQTEYRVMSSAPVARLAAERLGLNSHRLFDKTDDKPGFIARLNSLIPRRGVKHDIELSPLDVAAARVMRNLQVSPVRRSHLVHVSWIGEDPEIAAELANAVVDAYIRFTIESKYSTTDQAREFLVEQVGTLKTEIQAIENRLQEYGEVKRIISIDGSNNITLRALQDVAVRRTEAQARLAQTEATYGAVKNAEPDALPEVLNSPLIARLREEYAQNEAIFSEKSRKFKGQWPGMQTLKSKLDQSKLRLALETARVARQVRASAEAAYRTAQAEVGNFTALLADQADAAQRLKRDAVQFASLQSEVEKKRDTLTSLMKRRNEMALSTQLQDLDAQSTNIRVMETARAPRLPFRPRLRLNLVFGLMLGALLGVFGALFLEYMDNTVNTAAEIEGIVSLPTLAVIPKHGTTTSSSLYRVRRKRPVVAAASFDLIADADRQAAASEAFRELRTAILLSHAGQPPRHIMITSALPDEGKSATSLNLSIVLSQLGGRVLVVDTDLRRPRLDKVFGVETETGVSSYLSGLQSHATQVVVPTTIPNLDLMPSGPIPPNPSELLNSPRFTQMTQELLKQGYDHIVLDSPPVLSVSDPVVIASVVDASILVLRAGQTPRQSARLAVEKLRQAGGGLSGIVLNGVEVESTYHQYYYGSYGNTPEASDSDDERAVGTLA